MRDFKGMKRQRSRNRGGGGGGGKPQHNANRAFESNGPDGVKIRGAAQHVFEKYQQLARDALTAGDRVLGESYQQHAEHYFRVLRAVQPQRPASEIIGRDAFASGVDIDFEDELGEGEADTGPDAEGERAEARPDWRPEGRFEPRNRDRGYARDDRQRDERPSDRPRDERPREDRARDERQRDDRPRDDRPREDRPKDERPREERYRDERPREDRPRDERSRDDRVRAERPREERRPERAPVDPLALVEPSGGPLTGEPGSPILRSEDGAVSQAPAFLQARPEPADGDEPRTRSRRRRAPRALEGAAGDAPAGEDA